MTKGLIVEAAVETALMTESMTGRTSASIVLITPSAILSEYLE